MSFDRRASTEASERLLDLEAQIENEKLNSPTLAPQQHQEPARSGANKNFIIWTLINILATIGIVFTNKAIFDDPSFKLMQTSFACFHFLCTGLTLYVVSRKAIGAFVPKKAGIVDMLPLALAMCLNVVLPNLSLAFSTVTVYQLCRVLLTPMTVLINFILYSASIPRNAAIALFPVCIGVGITSYYDTKAVPGEAVKTTSTIGVAFALLGVFASSVYTVLIGANHVRLQMSSSQLLLNLAPISSTMLLFAVPIVDQIPVLSSVPQYRWLMILMSGVFASLINISQFFIVAGSGPVSSTVVGHLKTISIVSIGWVVSGRTVADSSLYGILMTIGGILAYSYIMSHARK